MKACRVHLVCYLLSILLLFVHFLTLPSLLTSAVYLIAFWINFLVDLPLIGKFSLLKIFRGWPHP